LKILPLDNLLSNSHTIDATTQCGPINPPEEDLYIKNWTTVLAKKEWLHLGGNPYLSAVTGCDALRFRGDYGEYSMNRIARNLEPVKTIPSPASIDRSKIEYVRPSQTRKETNIVSILFLAADPTDLSRLRLGEEFREIQEKLKLAKLRDLFRLELPQLSVRPSDITQALLDTQPQIVHFSGHGTSTGELCFEDLEGETHPIEPDALAALFEQFSGQVDCVILNACYSEIQAKAIAKHIKYVIGMNQAIGDKAAIDFAIGFYQALGGGRSIEDAYKLGRVQIQLQNIPEHLTPVLIKEGSFINVTA
jgi:hypothetical protein